MVRVQRVRPRTLFTIAALVGVYYLLLPELAKVGNPLPALETAQWAWVLVAIAFSVLTYVASAIGLLGGVSTLGRWTANQFVAILDVPPSGAMTLSRDVAQKLMEPYSFEDRGVPHTLQFQVAAGLLDHRAGGDVLKFHGKLEKLSAALSGGAQ